MSRSLVGLLAGCVGASGCGPGLKMPDAREAARVSLVDASGDPAAVAMLLRDSVTLGHLIFDVVCNASSGIADPDRRVLAKLGAHGSHVAANTTVANQSAAITAA